MFRVLRTSGRSGARCRAAATVSGDVAVPVMLRLLLYAAIVVTMCRCAPSQQPQLPSEANAGLILSSQTALGRLTRNQKTHRHHTTPHHHHQEESNAARNERSANLSHITGTSRKIQMHVKNRLLQLLPDGVVNGTSNDTDYSE